MLLNQSITTCCSCRPSINREQSIALAAEDVPRKQSVQLAVMLRSSQACLVLFNSEFPQHEQHAPTKFY
jgi:hypothetical protein